MVSHWKLTARNGVNEIEKECASRDKKTERNEDEEGIERNRWIQMTRGRGNKPIERRKKGSLAPKWFGDNNKKRRTHIHILYMRERYNSGWIISLRLTHRISSEYDVISNIYVGICDDKIECRHHLLFWISNTNGDSWRKTRRESFSRLFSEDFFIIVFFSFSLHHESWVTDLNLWSHRNINTIQPLNKQLSAISTWKKGIECEWMSRKYEETTTTTTKYSHFRNSQVSITEYDAYVHTDAIRITRAEKKEILSLNLERRSYRLER